ncbi:hypothetical protein I4U23_010976 [Adineta vaga]|nr:hypothetical protein I4U23_010976 [Adineta vaga]
MASSSPRKQCEKGDDCKQAGIAHCAGCLQTFCTKHFNDHRYSLNEELNTIFSDYNDFKSILIEESSNPNIASAIQQIHDWEIKTIEKIQHKAAELQHELSRLIDDHTKDLSEKLHSLAEQLQKAKEQDDFIETNLGHWKKKLDYLRSNVILPTTIFINQNDNIPLVSDVSISLLQTGHELFDYPLDNDVRIEEDGEVAVAVNYITRYSGIRGKNFYGVGLQKITLKIEHPRSQWTFLGIQSKSIPIQKASYLSKSLYGWCNKNYIYSNGSYQSNKTNTPIQMNTNDIITLFLNCENRKIVMINEMNFSKYELEVDINNCPFPWQLHVILREQHSRIRLLPT